MRKRMHGFTLMELMIVVVVIGILASIAVPSYRQYVLRTNRTDATTMLLRIQAAQEKFFLQNNQYASDAAALGVTAVTEGGKYNIQVAQGASGTNMTFLATATPTAGGGQLSDTRCRTFTINELGVRTGRDSGGADRSNECWGRR
jgi:type IV pilus assembly protein PilE